MSDISRFLAYTLPVDAGHLAVVPEGIYRAKDIVGEGLFQEFFLEAGTWDITAEARGWMPEKQSAHMRVDLQERTRFIVGDTCYWMVEEDRMAYARLCEAVRYESAVLGGNTICLNTGGDGMMRIIINAKKVDA